MTTTDAPLETVELTASVVVPARTVRRIAARLRLRMVMGELTDLEILMGQILEANGVLDYNPKPIDGGQ